MSTQSDTIIETRTCKTSGKQFTITEKDAEFYKKISPTFGEYKAEIPFPTLCPEERKRRRFAFRNERKLYRRICDATKQPIISIYSPDKKYKVYDQKIRRCDSRDGLDYGREFDFTRTFTEQFGELMSDVPRMSLVNKGGENSAYCNYALDNLNVHLCYSVSNSTDCMYGRRVDNCSNSYDILNTRGCENCYMLIGSTNCYDCYMSINLKDCSYCINCYDLIGKQFCINNIQYSREEFFELKKNTELDYLILANHDKNKANFNNEDCDDCSLITNSIHCISCSDINEGENLKYCQMIKPKVSDCIDASLMLGGSLNMEVMSTLFISRGISCYGCWTGSDVYYSSDCFNGNNLFGCVGVRDKSYCIFNKQYTKEEYNILVPKIIEHMKNTGERGEFFDSRLSPFGYNETIASEYLPLSEKEVSNLGYNRSTYESPTPQSSKVINGSDLSEKIEEVDDEILTYAIKCEVTGKLFRIQPQELEFYKKHGIPMPRKHPDQRHLERIAMRK